MIESLLASTDRSSPWHARRQLLGRRARSQAEASASLARYAARPALRLISRVMLEAARPNCAAMQRAERLAAIPREISSRSRALSADGARRRTAGAIPPLAQRTLLTRLPGTSSARAISAVHSPAFQRLHNS